MDPKKEIDSNLQAIGRDRKWLAEKTGYSYFSVRDCLAPDGKKLSKRMLNAFTTAIETDQSEKTTALSNGPALPDRITIEATPQEFDAWNKAAMQEKQALKEWAVEALNEAAEEWKQLKVAEDPKPYKADQSKKA